MQQTKDQIRLAWLAGAVVALATVAALSGCGSTGAAAPMPTVSGPAGPETPAAADADAASADSTGPGEPGIPAAAMLLPSHLGDGFWPQTAEDAHWWLELLVAPCAAEPLAKGPLPSRTRVLSREAKPFTGVYQGVYRHRGDSAADYLARIREAVESCEATRGEGSRLSLVDSDFAGQESYLVKDEYDGDIDYYVLVRQGEVHTDVLLSMADVSEDRARALGETAAVRLCEATETC